MPRNRSVPPDILLPHLIYRDVEAAVAWLGAAFGFAEHYRYGPAGGPAQGAQLRLGNAWIMAEQARDGRDSPARLGGYTQSLTIFVADVDTHCARARSAGATITEEPNETPYGEYQYAAADHEGHRWLFARHARDVDPEAWGATTAYP